MWWLSGGACSIVGTSDAPPSGRWNDTIDFCRAYRNRTRDFPAPVVTVPSESEPLGLVNTPEENTDTLMPGDPSTALVDDADNVGLADVSSTRKTVQTSSNPLFADGVPEHLQCPEELIGVYAKGLPTEELLFCPFGWCPPVPREPLPPHRDTPTTLGDHTAASSHTIHRRKPDNPHRLPRRELSADTEVVLIENKQVVLETYGKQRTLRLRDTL